MLNNPFLYCTTLSKRKIYICLLLTYGAIMYIFWIKHKSAFSKSGVKVIASIVSQCSPKWSIQYGKNVRKA